MHSRLTMDNLAILAAILLEGSVALAQAAPTTAPSPASAPVEAPATRPAPAAQAPSTLPADADQAPPSRPAPGETPARPERLIRFQFEGQKLSDLVKNFVPELTGRGFMGDPSSVPGTFTYVDSQGFTPEQALSIINYALRQNGFTLIKNDSGVMELLPLNKIGPDVPIIEAKPGEQIETQGPQDELVTAVIPLRFIDSSQASAAIIRMVHSFGMVSQMGKGKGIVITDTVSNIRRIQRVLFGLDKGTTLERQLKSYQMKHGSADEMARLLERVLGATQQQQPRQWQIDPQTGRYVPVSQEPADTVQIAADARTNMVILMGSADKLAMAEELIAKVDIEQQEGEGAVRIFELKNAKADELARTINQVIQQQVTVSGRPGGPVSARSVSVRVVADPGSNRVIASAPPDIMKQIEDLVTKLDAASREAGGFRVFALKTANAPNLVNVIVSAFARRDGQGRTMTNFSVSADARTNTLVVNGPAADLEGVAKLVEQLDKPLEPGQGREIHVYRLQVGDARQLADSLRRILSERPAQGPRGGGQGDDTSPRIEADTGTNSLIIACVQGEWDRIKGYLDELKVDVIEQLTATTKIFKVQHASAGELVSTLQQIFDPRRRQGSPRAQGQPAPIPVVVSYDSRSNAIVVSASGEDMTEIDNIVKMLDVEGAPEAKLEVRTYAMAGVNAADVAKSLERLFALGQGPRGQQPRPGQVEPPQPRFEAEPNSNQLIVIATAEQFTKTIDGLIQKMQGQIEQTTKVDTRLYQLKHARADLIVDAIKKTVEAQLANKAQMLKSTRKIDSQVAADAQTNTLIVTAPTESLTLVENLLKTIDADVQDPARATVTKFIKLVNADSTEVANSINAALAGQPARGNRPGQPDLTALGGKRVQVVAAPNARAVLLTGSQEDLAQAEELVKKLDEQPSAVTATIQTFELKYARAEDVARVLSETIGQTGPLTRSGIPTRVSAEPNSNRVVVHGAGDVVTLVGELVKQMDVAGAVDQAITQIILLENADATEVANAINAALAGQETAQGPRTGRAGQGQVNLTGLAGKRVRCVAAQGARSVLLTGSKDDVAFAGDLIKQIDLRPASDKPVLKQLPLKYAKADDISRMLNDTVVKASAGRNRPGAVPTSVSSAKDANAVVVSGSGEIVEQIGKLVKELDTDIAAGGAAKVEIVKLENAKAEPMAAALTAALAVDPRRPQPGRTDEEPPKVTPEPVSNTLLVSGRPAQIEDIKKLVKQLDTGGMLVMETKIFPLQFAKAGEILPVLQAILANQTQGPRVGPRGGVQPQQAPEVRIAAQDKSNAIVVQAPPDVMKLAEEIIRNFDQKDSGSVVEIVRLSRAEPVSLADAVNQALADKTAGRPAPGVVAPDTALVVAEPNSGSVLVRGPKAEVEKAVLLIKSLDEGGQGTGTQVRSFVLKFADATTAAKTLEVLFKQIIAAGQRGSPGRNAPPAPTFSISSDERTNTVFVSTTAAYFALVENMVKQMDVGEGAGIDERGIEYVTLTMADAYSAASTLDNLFINRPKTDRPVISVDYFANALSVIAKESDLKLIQSTVAKLEKAAGLTYVRIKVISMPAGIRPETMAEIIKNVYGQTSGQEVIIKQGAEPVTGADNLFQPLVLELPADAAPASRPATNPASRPATWPAESATRSTGVPPVASSPPSTGETPVLPPGGKPPVVIAFDNKKHVLIISAGRTEMESIQSLIDQLTPAAGEMDVEMKVFKVQNADVVQMARTLDALFNPRPMMIPGMQIPQPQPGQRGPRGQQPGQQPAPGQPQVNPQAAMLAALKPNITIAADVRTRSVIVRGKPTDLDAIGEIIKTLDKAPEASFEVRVFPLKNLDATEIASNLRELFGQVSSSVAGAAARGAAARQVAGQPNVPGALQIPVLTSTAEQLRRLVELHREQGDVIVDLSSAVTITPNRNNNSLIVTAPLDAMALIEKLVQEMDQSLSPTATTVKMFKLEKADVSEVVDTLTRLFGQARGAGLTGPRAQTATGGGAIVAGNDAARMVIVSARTDDFPAIEKVIKDLDEAGKSGEVIVQVIKLQFGDARSVADALTRTLAQGGAPGSTGPRRTGVAAGGGDLIRISPETGSNSIIVRAPQEDQDQIAKYIAELDKEPETVKATFQVIQLTRSDAREISDALTRMIQSWPRKPNEPRPTVGFDRVNNKLMLSGPPKDMERLAQMVTDLEAGAAGSKPQFQTITLQHARASDVAAALGQFYGAKAANAAAAERNVTIAADDRTGALLVSAPPELLAKIAEQVGKMDTEGGEVKKAVISLTYAQADTVARAINQAFAPAPGTKPGPAELVVASAEPGTNNLVISASDKNLQAVQALVKQIDVQATGKQMQFVRLEKARAVDVAKALNDVLSKRRPAAGAEPPSVSAEGNANILLLAGSKADVEMMQGLAKSFEEATPAGGAGEPQILPLKKADATSVAAMLNQLWQQRAQQERAAGKIPEQVAISADRQSNAIVVIASATALAQITTTVNQIDEMVQVRGTNLRLIQLKYANPDDVLKAIQTIYGSPAQAQVTRPPARPGGGARPAVAGAGSANASVLAEQRALLIDASDEDWAVIQKLIETLDTEAQKLKKEVEVIVLTKAPNTQVAAQLTALYRGAQRPNRPEDVVTVVPLPGTNALVVTAVREKLDEIVKLVKELDEKITTTVETKIYTLTNNTAAKVLVNLQRMIQPLVQANPSQPITLTADERANTIIVTTGAPVFPQLEKMIKLLDEVPPFKSAEVTVIPLKLADAVALAAVLTDILTPGTSRIQTPEARALQEQVRLLQMKKGNEGLPALDLSKPIKITSDPMTAGAPGSNSLIITSTPENLKALAEIVSVLDTMPFAKGVRLQIIHLKNADAISVMTLLRDVFTQGQRLAGKPGTPLAGKARPETVTGEGLTGQLDVTADARTNSLIIAGSDETVALASLIVKDLDQQASSEFTEVKVIKLLNADAVRLAPIIRTAFAEQAGGAAAPAGAAGAQGARDYVTRLRALRDKEAPVQTEIARAYPTVSVQAEPNANLLLIVARSDLLPLIEEMVRVMDVPGAGSMNAVRIYPLVNADAARMATVIGGLYTGANSPLIRAEDKPTITVDIRTNSLVVNASEKTFGVIDSLLAKLDAKLPIDLRDIRLVPLQNADAASLATTLQRMMDARVQRQQSLGVADAEALRVIVTADARTNYLIVGGSAEGFKLVEELAKQLDAAPVALAGQVQIVPLTNANAGTLSAMLVNLFTQRYAAVRDPNLARQRPVIVPDLRINALLLAATQDDSQVINDLVKKLDAAPTSPAVELVVLPMKWNDAGSVGATIQRIMDSRRTAMTAPGQQPNPQDVVTIVTDGITNALIVSASKDNLVTIKDLLAKVDMEPPTETGVVRMYALEHADATRVADLLRTLVQQGLYKPGLVSAAGSPTLTAREKVSIAVDVRTNVIIVSASKENFNVLEEIIKRADSAEAWGLTGNIKTYLLKNANALTLGTMLQQMFDRKRTAETATGGQARSLPVVIVSDERTNSLLVAASNEAFDAIDALIGKLDTADIISTHQFAIFPLKLATAATLEPMVRQLFAARVALAGQRLTPVTVLSDSKTNTLIVGGDRSDLVMAEDLINRLDKAPPATGETMRVFPIMKADATTLAATITQLYAARQPGGVSGVGVSVNAWSNAILVTAGKGDMDNIADLIAKLDTTPVTDVTEIRIFNLRRALSSQVATVLTDALTRKPVALTPVSPNRAALIRFVGEANGKKLEASAVKEGIMITPFDSINSLVVQAPVDTMPLVASLIEALDNSVLPTAEIHVFALRNADATQLARVLTELFKLSATGGATTGRQALQYVVASPAGAGPAVGEQSPAQVGMADQSAITITVDSRTNSLLVGGSKEYVTLCGRVIEELDASPAEDRQVLVYHPRNATAADLETALKAFVDQENQKYRSVMGANALPAARELLAREAVIVAEPTSNSLLISGSPRFFKTISLMVQELDQPSPQVLIQVLLAEVKLDDTTELGLEWKFRAEPTNDLRARGATNFGISGAVDGFTFSVTGGDITPLLRAMQAQGRLEVLSRPQLTVADNQPGNLNIGQEVPFVTSSRVLDTGVVNTIEYRKVGILLDVTPRIGADGFVKLQVAPTISSVSEATVKISENLNALILDSRSAKTTVTCQDGHTVIIGGLITKKEQNREDKVPILGDIPILGLLFKNTKLIKERSELLIILTPKIMRIPSDADILTNKEIRQLNLAKGISTDASIGELLNPLKGVSPEEIKRLEQGLAPGSRSASRLEPVVIPMTLEERESLIKERLLQEQLIQEGRPDEKTLRSLQNEQGDKQPASQVNVKLK